MWIKKCVFQIPRRLFNMSELRDHETVWNNVESAMWAPYEKNISQPLPGVLSSLDMRQL